MEKQAAPFDEQLVEAAKFVGLGLNDIRRISDDDIARDGQRNVVLYHGREEWLLRWLLKKLQGPGDEVPRLGEYSNSFGALI